MTAEQLIFVEQIAQHFSPARDTVYSRRKHRGLPALRTVPLCKSKLTDMEDWARAGDVDELIQRADDPK